MTVLLDLNMWGLVALNVYVWPTVVRRLIVPGTALHWQLGETVGWVRPFVVPAVAVVAVQGDSGSYLVSIIVLLLYFSDGHDDDHRPWSRLGKRLTRALFPHPAAGALGTA